MSTIVKGIYRNGQVRLFEPPEGLQEAEEKDCTRTPSRASSSCSFLSRSRSRSTPGRAQSAAHDGCRRERLR